MAMKKNGNKDESIDACICEIDELMGDLARLTDNSKGFREIKREWTKLKGSFAKLGTIRKTAQSAVAKATKKATAAGRVTQKADPLKKPMKTAKTVRKEADDATPQPPVPPQITKEPPLPSSVRISDREMELHLGSFGAKPLAEHDASELIGHPMVFWYRRGVFPDPRQSRVNPTVIEAKVVERKGKAFRSAPFTVHVKIGMAGDVAHCRSWAKGVLARNKGDQE